MEIKIPYEKWASYYDNNAQKLHSLVDSILYKLHFHDVNNDDFYSLSNEVFYKALRDYDGVQSFDGFLYSCLTKKFKSEMTYLNRKKRKGNLPDVSWDEMIDSSEEITYSDVIFDEKSDFEADFIEKNVKKHVSAEVKIYLSNLSPLQKKIALMIADDYTPSEICEKLHITTNHYKNLFGRITSDENIKILRPLVERN